MKPSKTPSRHRLFAALPALAALALLPSSCTTTASLTVQEVPDVSLPGAAAAKAGKPVVPGKNFHGHPGMAKPSVRLILTKREWDDLWPEGYQVPSIDFSKEMVLAAFDGERRGQGHRLTFQGASVQGGVLQVDLVAHQPPEECVRDSSRLLRPALILTLPRRMGKTQVNLRRHVEATCLLPPEFEVTCRVDAADGKPLSAFRNALPFALPGLGDQVTCAAMSEPGARTFLQLEFVPEGSGVPTGQRTAKGSLTFTPDVPGQYVVSGEATRGDGFLSLKEATVLAGTPGYRIALVEEEPEGLKGYELLVRRIDLSEVSPSPSQVATAQDAAAEAAPSSGESTSAPAKEPSSADVSNPSPEVATEAPKATASPSAAGGGDGVADEEDDEGEDVSDACSPASPRKWCLASSDGYAHEVMIPATMPDGVEVLVRRTGNGAAPQARLSVSLADHPLLEIPLPDDLSAWADDPLLPVAVLDPTRASASESR